MAIRRPSHHRLKTPLIARHAALLAAACACTSAVSPVTGPVPAGSPTILTRFATPEGFERVGAGEGSFGNWLRALPLQADGTPVHLYNGALKSRQDVHAAVIDMSVGGRDLQQCADAVMRLRAEHLFATGRQDEIAFHFTSGFLAEWSRWRRGERIAVDGNDCRWLHRAEPDDSHEELLRFLNIVFTYAGTLSLEKELRPAGTADLRIGDVFINGGSPGHAVIVTDVARNADGRTVFLLAQSYMPAQEIHVLRNLRRPDLGAWFIAGDGDALYTPEWTFQWEDQRRFPERAE